MSLQEMLYCIAMCPLLLLCAGNADFRNTQKHALPPPTETRMKAIRVRKAFVSAKVSVWKVLGKVELVLQISHSDECTRNVPASTVETVLCAV